MAHVLARASVPMLMVWAAAGCPIPVASAQPQDVHLVSTKSRSTFYPPEARRHAIANAERYEWARKQVAEAVEAAAPFLNMSDDELWELSISPKLQRSLDVNLNKGCPNCGMAMYGERGPRPYAWLASVPGQDWKVQCPNCREIFPKNDFGKFYQSALDPETGLFEPSRGDRSLLFNVDHPDPNDPKHTYGVDDGSGWRRGGDDPNQRDFYVAYHVLFGRASRMSAAMRSLAYAYALTGKPEYAHKCAIMLDRHADMHPDYDGAAGQFFNGVWGHYSDGLIGPNYWAGGAWTQRAIDYDMIYDGIDDAAVAFLRDKAKHYKTPLPKESLADIRRNIEERILIDCGTRRKRVWMNGTITEMCTAKVDLVLRGQQALEEFPTRHLPLIAPPRNLNDDGSGNERSTGYDAGAFGEYCSLIRELYDLDPSVVREVIRQYPKIANAFDFWADIWCLEKYIPRIGDIGDPGHTAGINGSPAAYLAMFDITGKPRYAQAVLRMAKGEMDKLPRNIFAAEPEGLIERAIAADKEAGAWSTPSVVKPDYGLAILRGGSKQAPNAAWFFAASNGGTSSHSHFDALTIGLFAFDLEMICEHGYPLYTGGWPARWAWTSHTRSHAGVTVDGQCQKHCGEWKLLGFGERDQIRFVSAEAPCVYDGVSRYRRTLASVDVADGRTVLVDVFRVRGGRLHQYVVPFFYGESTAEGLELAPQGDIFDGYVTEVRSAPAAKSWFVDTAIRSAPKEDFAAHLRVHGAASDAKVLLGRGESKWGKDDPRWLPYLIVERSNDAGNLESTFVVVYEPYRDKPFLAPGSLRVTAGAESVSVHMGSVGSVDDPGIVVTDGDGDQVVVSRMPADN